MLYLTIYLGLALLFSFLVGLVHFHDCGRDEMFGYMLAAAIILAWPLALISLPLVLIYVARRDAIKEATDGAKLRVQFGTYEQSRESVGKASTDDLKLLLKGARAGRVDLKANQIEILKRELIDRATENGLLK